MVASADGSIVDLYSTDEYISKNPSLHEADSGWKTGKILPLVDAYLSVERKNEINLLDVGGGAGIILRNVADHIARSKKVNKFSLDLSPGMLDAQKRTNPDVILALNEDIRNTSLRDKQIDLTMMIDTLEHIPDPAKALEELRRISRYVIFKVPLEDNLELNLYNLVTNGRQRKKAIDTVGHINIYNLKKLREQIEDNGGAILQYYFTNAFDYYNRSGLHKSKLGIPAKAANFLGDRIFRISPGFSSYIFNDFVMLLVKF